MNSFLNEDLGVRRAGACIQSIHEGAQLDKACLWLPGLVCPWHGAHLQRSSLRHLKAVLSHLQRQRAFYARNPALAGMHVCSVSSCACLVQEAECRCY